MHYSKVLRNVIVSRQFTIYQLTNTILYDLPKRIQTTQTKTDSHFWLVRLILSDPEDRTAEAERLVSQIVTSLHNFKDVFVVLTSRLIENLEIH